MRIQKGYRFKLRPISASRDHAMRKTVGSCCFVWNKFLQLNLARLRRGQRVLSAFDMNNRLPLLKRIYPWLKSDPYSQNLQQVTARLHRAFLDAFDREQPDKRMPTFKKKHHSCSARYPNGKSIQVEGNRVRLPKLGSFRFFKSQEIEGTIKNATLKWIDNAWYVSIQVEQTISDPYHQSPYTIGIDLGVKKFAAIVNDNTGYRHVIKPLNAFRREARRLAKAQRVLSRKEKFSNNWKKQKRIVQKIHSRIARMRRDFLQKESTKISNSHAMVAVENLKVTNMTKSAKGTVEEPGKSVARKSGLNQAILDQGWGMFVEMLEYKLTWNGGTLVKVPAPYTSQRCPECDHVCSGNRRTQAKFACVQCGFQDNADFVGATNVHRAGQLVHCGKRVA